MNWEALGSIAEVVGVLVVLPSLLYLAIQVKQTNLQAEASAQADWMNGWNAAIKGWIASPETIEAMQTGFSDLDALPPAQAALFHMHLAALTNQWVLGAELYDRGLLPESVYDGATSVVVSVHSTPGARAFLQRNAKATPRGPQLLELVENPSSALAPITDVFPWWNASGAEDT